MIRQAASSDAEVLAELEMLLFPENCINEYSLTIELTVGFGYIVGEGEGYALVRPDGDIWDLLRLGVRSTHQGLGHGKALLVMILELADHRKKSMMLTVKKSNKVALSLYRKFGFEPIASMPQHEAIIMARPLPTSPSR